MVEKKVIRIVNVELPSSEWLRQLKTDETCAQRWYSSVAVTWMRTLPSRLSNGPFGVQTLELAEPEDVQEFVDELGFRVRLCSERSTTLWLFPSLILDLLPPVAIKYLNIISINLNDYSFIIINSLPTQ